MRAFFLVLHAILFMPLEVLLVVELLAVIASDFGVFLGGHVLVPWWFLAIFAYLWKSSEMSFFLRERYLWFRRENLTFVVGSLLPGASKLRFVGIFIIHFFLKFGRNNNFWVRKNEGHSFYNLIILDFES